MRQIGIGDPVGPDGLDLLFMGGGQDGDQRLMADDLFRLKADALRGALEDGLPMLVVCGGYQLFGHYYQPAAGPRLPGLGLFDLHTVHPGSRVPRCIGNVVIEWAPPGADGDGRCRPAADPGGLREPRRADVPRPGRAPLGRVLHGHGNNARDGTEGAAVGNAFGTYLHGSLLPKNPHLADHLLRLALCPAAPRGDPRPARRCAGVAGARGDPAALRSAREGLARPR